MFRSLAAAIHFAALPLCFSFYVFRRTDDYAPFFFFIFCIPPPHLPPISACLRLSVSLNIFGGIAATNATENRIYMTFLYSHTIKNHVQNSSSMRMYHAPCVAHQSGRRFASSFFCCSPLLGAAGSVEHTQREGASRL
jgi:hypothetical protein